MVLSKKNPDERRWRTMRVRVPPKLSALVLVLCLCAVLNACAGSGSGSGSAAEPAEEAPASESSPPAEEYGDEIVLAERGGTTEFTLVCDLADREEALADIFRIRDAFKKDLRVELPVKDSGQKDDGSAEIVVNARNRKGCADLLAGLEKGEFAVRVSPGGEGEQPKINIAYKGDAARMCAVNAFLDASMNGEKAAVPADLDLRGSADGLLITSSIPVLRDPFIVLEDGVYYAYGTGWVCYENKSGSLAGGWNSLGVVVDIPADAEGDHWAPEVHRRDGKFYMFTTYRSRRTGHRGCSIFESDTPTGPFREITDGHVTPKNWDSIDGTYYVDESGQPWMIFVHEWTSTPDSVGRMAAAKLSDDLTHFISEPVELFRADDAKWAKNGVTDGCFMHRCADGQLLMLWSNWDSAGYCVGIARSATGAVEGPWTQDSDLLYSKNMTGEYDGGHGMLFTAADGSLYLSIHSPNSAVGSRRETPVFIRVKEKDGTLVWDTPSVSGGK